MITSADLANPDLPAERIYQSLSAYVKEHLTCHCLKDYREETKQFPAPHDIHSYCTRCRKPSRFAVTYVIQVCEGCDKYYLPRIEDYRNDWQPGQPAIRWKLCASCDVPSRNEQQHTTRTEFRFS